MTSQTSSSAVGLLACVCHQNGSDPTLFCSYKIVVLWQTYLRYLPPLTPPPQVTGQEKSTMSELEQLRQESEQLRNQIRVSRNLSLSIQLPKLWRPIPSAVNLLNSKYVHMPHLARLSVGYNLSTYAYCFVSTCVKNANVYHHLKGFMCCALMSVLYT